MRRALGVLRHTDDRLGREPAPGVGQLSWLIERAREAGQDVELVVSGRTGALPAAVDLSIYRIIEDALQSIGPSGSGPLGICLSLREEELQLRLTATRPSPSPWPTDAMRHRVAICRGQLDTSAAGASWQLTVTLPRAIRRTYA
jgi:signal transduction histidine kinase